MTETETDASKIELKSSPKKGYNSLSLFKLDKLMTVKVKNAAFCENGLRKLLAVVGEENLFFHYTSPTGSHCQLNYAWDFQNLPIQNLCFEPSGTWLLVVCHASLHVLPFLCLFEPDGSYDQKWLLNDMTTVKLDEWFITTCVAALWWLTKSLQHILIIGEKNGDVIFFSLDECIVVGIIKISVEINDLQICVDDGLDFITLLINTEEKQWRLVLEHRSMKYNWLEPSSTPSAPQETPQKKEGFMATIKQYGAEKMAMLSQRRTAAPADESSTKTINYTRHPVLYTVRDFQLTKMWDISLTEFEHGWLIAPQYSDGRHFISAYNQTLNALILQCIEGGGAAHVLRIKRDSNSTHLYEKSKVMWTQRLLYLFAEKTVEIHSTHFASEASVECSSCIWEHDLEGTILRGWRVAPNTQFPPGILANLIGPKPPPVLLDRCLIVTTEAVYLVSTVCDPCEWLVGVVCSTADVSISADLQKATSAVKAPKSPSDSEDGETVSPLASPKHSTEDRVAIGGAGENACSALAAPLRDIVRSAATLLLASGAMSKATRLYRICLPSMSGWAEVAGALGRWRAVAAFPVQQYERNTNSRTDDLLSHALARLLLDTTDTWRKNTFDELVIHIKRWDLVAGSPEIWLACSSLGAWQQLRSLQKHFCSVSVPSCSVEMHDDDVEMKDDTQTSDDMILPKYLCRGAWAWLLNSRGGVRQFFRMISRKCIDCSSCEYCVECGTSRGLSQLLECVRQQQHLYDDELLKEICVWICPLQEELRPLMKIFMVGSGRCLADELQLLISTFLSVCCTICSRSAQPFLAAATLTPGCESNAILPTEKQPSVVISTSTYWWGISHKGAVQFGGALPPGVLDFDFCGLSVKTLACGRDHALLLTSEGLYSAGDNRYGQLGCGWFGGGGGWSIVLGGVRTSHIIDVSAGQYHSAVLTENGSVYTWGWGVHGQLGHGGAADDESQPRKVLGIPSVKSVKCGAHHTVVLTVDGNICIWGAGVFGQLGNGRKEKSSLPLQVDLGIEKISMISAGHFHTLALSDSGDVWLWGCSPQSLRIGTTSRRMNTAQTKSFESLPSENPQPIEQVLPKELHLSPRTVDVSNVIGKVVDISGGWNHSCLVDDRGHVYLWGLNLEGQLGTGDRKEVLNPRQLNLVIGKAKEDVDGPLLHEIDCIAAACGGDFTFAVDVRGGIFRAGNRHDQNWIGPVRVLKMKSSNRIVRLPGHSPGDLSFVKWGHLNQFNTESQILGQSESIHLIDNPLRSAKSFNNFQWVDAIFSALEPWVKDDVLEASQFLMARMHLLRGNFERSLRHQLDHFGTPLVSEPLKYYAHLDPGITEKVDIARRILSERIKDVCKSILNEETSKEFDRSLYSPIKCLCNEETVELINYNNRIYGREPHEVTPSEAFKTWWSAAAGMLSIAPNPVSLADVLVKWWHEKYSTDKDSYVAEVENYSDNRDYEDKKHKVERQYSKEDVEAMETALRGAGNDAAAEIALFSAVTAQFEGLLSPDFYLTQCDTLFEQW